MKLTGTFESIFLIGIFEKANQMVFGNVRTNNNTVKYKFEM
jgi:hypothetical protein